MRSASHNPAEARKVVLVFLRTVVVAVIMLPLFTPAPAQDVQSLPPLVELSPGVTVARPDLAGRRAALVREREALLTKFKQHSERCKVTAPENKMKVSDCANERAELAGVLKAHIARSENFNADSVTACEEHKKPAGSNQAITKSLEYQCDFHVLTADGQHLMGSAGVPIGMGSKITTNRNSEVKLTLLDDTHVTIGANTELMIDVFVYDSNSLRARSAVSLIKGTLRWLTGPSPGGGWTLDRKIKTPAVVTSFRGADLEIMALADGPGYIKLFDGQLEITATKTGDVVVINAHQIVTLNPDGTIGRPMPLKQ
jgi:FecR protein